MKLQISIIVTVILCITAIVPHVQAVTQDDVVGYWTFEFQPGFNLVAFPLLPGYASPEEVIGSRLGDVEVLGYDKRIGRYRWARYNSDTGRWMGDLYLINRGKAYWINLLDAEETIKMTVTGKPELYENFNWEKLNGGWQFYAPTYGQSRDLSELPPSNPSDILLSWNSRSTQFEIAEAMNGNYWNSVEFSKLSADKAFMVYLNRREVRYSGPPTLREQQLNRLEDQHPGMYPGEDSDVDYITPPLPLVVGNSGGLPVCSPDGSVCTGGFDVTVMRESIRQGFDGNQEVYAERIAQRFVAVGDAEYGKFRMALTVGENEKNLHVGDRIYMIARNAEGARTRSTSFEVPVGTLIVGDVSFDQPMSALDGIAGIPSEFSISRAFPNPFNDRFQVDVSLPEATPMKAVIFDISGRQVRSIERPFSAGNHRVSFEAEGMAAGLYMLEISSGIHSGLLKVAHVK